MHNKCIKTLEANKGIIIFAVVGYPRSRTKWFAEFLTHGNNVCLHEPPFNDWFDLVKFVNDGNGISDSALILSWKELINRIPEIKIVLVKRPKSEVKESLSKIGLNMTDHGYEAIEDSISELEKQPNVYVVDYHNINNEHKNIFRFCRGYDCPDEKSALLNTNIQYSLSDIEAMKNNIGR